ncbi:hypothetical protein QOZ88_19320 [Blastococcus sp. BMG 814]|uniref:Uncharacterized protein n=1 Tax=Blastococcus carthaginiensis TaxID=3050034 RepID=A0ABT9IGT7_9ACTN|nr:hypothetical protein [Blastococcus carthaginiensis]MDP5184789.1 hypothetical protein [Blastococcus carthaginiensis]
MSRAFTRAQIDTMGPQELAANADAINAWAAAGAVEGQAPPTPATTFTVEQLQAMSAEEMAVNIDAVNASLRGHGAA